ncbi:Zn finger protein [Methanonatronarchaeum thermophilum]|uniref:Zn finger protein n=1 Tax=Methanonatronarchaeum thermophilum TaxID=1927129 RepID=A0A1Y3GAY1_9EURY|nr:hypothetical protein [Methanonatronarchaeum thermophilum]OUJ18427.1 Zn finger protein [Methanonatronarchaeum thermophilum]
MNDYGIEKDPEKCTHEWMPYELSALKMGAGLGATQPSSWRIHTAICVRCGKLKSLYQMARKEEYEEEMDKLWEEKNKDN